MMVEMQGVVASITGLSSRAECRAVVTVSGLTGDFDHRLPLTAKNATAAFEMSLSHLAAKRLHFGQRVKVTVEFADVEFVDDEEAK